MHDGDRDTTVDVMLDILTELTPLNRVFCSSDYDRSIDYLGQFLPFEVIEFPATKTHNGWVIPPKWDVLEAKILRDGKLIYDGTQHALSVIALSLPFEGSVGLDELKRHLHYDDRFTDAIPYHFRQEYRSWDRDWGFCVTKDFYESLTPGTYDVVLKTQESEGKLRLLEFTHHGRLPDTIVLAAHLDHPGMANDDLAGCAVGVELFRRLQGHETRFTYKLLLHQEVIGSEYYLAFMDPSERETILEGLFLEMLGTETQFGLQSARGGITGVEVALDRALRECNVPSRRGPYGSIVVNGEYVWDAYGIPMASFSRYPYPEYHTDHDNLSIISSRALEEAVEVLERAVRGLESTPLVKRNFTGSLCASNPQYDLYIDPGEAAFGGFTTDEVTLKLRELMEVIPSLKGPTCASVLSAQLGLSDAQVVEYLKGWEARGLVDLQ